MAKKQSKNYGPANSDFKSLDQAYAQYSRDQLYRTSKMSEAKLAPKSRFAQIWGWAPGLKIGKASK